MILFRNLGHLCEKYHATQVHAKLTPYLLYVLGKTWS
jgi:hypothetical protein